MSDDAGPRCRKCGRAYERPQLFAPRPGWGRVPAPLCVRCWSAYAVAREAETYVDWHDAFDNAPDERLAEYLARHPELTQRLPRAASRR